MDSPHWVVSVLEWLKDARKVVFVIGATAVVLIVGVRWGRFPPAVAGFVAAFEPCVYIAAIASALYFLFELGGWVRDRLGEHDEATRAREDTEQTLKALTDQERAVLWEFVRQQRRALQLPGALPELRSLVALGLIVCHEGALLGSVFEIWCSISDAAWDQLQEQSRRSSGTAGSE